MRVKSSTKQPQPTRKDRYPTTVQPPLTAKQFTTLLKALTHHLTWGKPGGRPPAVSLTQDLKMTLLYHRHNLTEELLAEIFNTSQPTVSRTINLIERTLETILKPAVTPLEKALKVIGVTGGWRDPHPCLELALTRYNKFLRQTQESWFQSPGHVHPWWEAAGHHWPQPRKLG